MYESSDVQTLLFFFLLYRDTLHEFMTSTFNKMYAVTNLHMNEKKEIESFKIDCAKYNTKKIQYNFILILEHGLYLIQQRNTNKALTLIFKCSTRLSTIQSVRTF